MTVSSDHLSVSWRYPSAVNMHVYCLEIIPYHASTCEEVPATNSKGLILCPLPLELMQRAPANLGLREIPDPTKIKAAPVHQVLDSPFSASNLL
jgi:hypothetical protein